MNILTSVDKLKKPYFKVLIRRRQWVPNGPVVAVINGGYSNFNYKKYLPGHGHPGKWLKIPQGRGLTMCHVGFHVTTNPVKWGSGRSDLHGVYAVEIKGSVLQEHMCSGGASDKICCRQIRLLYRVVRKNRKWVRA